MVNFLIYDFSNTLAIVEYILLVALLVSFCVTLGFLSRRKLLTTLVSGLSALCITALTLFNDIGQTNALFYILVCLLFSFFVVIIFINLGPARKYFVFKSPNAPKAKKGKQVETVKIFNRDQLFDVITSTVTKLSRTKTGAIITFEKNDNLKPLIKNGVKLDCYVNQELLETIFYQGTRLHDGAVIIKDDKIIAASVYYTLTTKPLSGKYGSRHRAAIGISELSDSVTIVVSEETGRISIAQNGGIEAVPVDNFKRIFTDAMENE